MAAAKDRGVPLSTLCPKYLHSNSTSHTWPFSAIAELIDNAYDPDVDAKQFWIDKTIVKGETCLSFMDNGNGLDQAAMHKMLSFGYSEKTAVKGVQPIGTYGNGFKSGSMRLGRDAIVFSKSKTTSCVGMLSQTYLEKIGANQIIVPIVCFEQTESNELSTKDEHKASLQDILNYSPFTTQEDLLAELKVISHPGSIQNTGTRIIIWNLRRTTSGTLEFDFEKDRYDIQIPTESMNDTNQQPVRSTSNIPESDYSLRAYCSILYLKPRMQVVIRGQKVKTQLIAKSLAYIKKDRYKPTSPNNENSRKVCITFGYNTKSKEQYGIMMYHKNRLIKAYERVGCQLKANNQGVGVIGVIECNFLDPTHNKQSFDETALYRKIMYNLGIKLEEYWKEICYRRTKENPKCTTPVEDTTKRPDQNWVQCDECLRWRKLPDGIDCSKLPDKWFCHMNPDPQFRNCSVEEEPEDSDDDQPTYRKTYKQQERENKKQQEKKRQMDEEEQRSREVQHLALLTKQTQSLKRQHEKLKRQLHQTTVNSPSTSTIPKSRISTESEGAAWAESATLRSSTISQAACSPSSYSGLPVISNVCSLSPALQRGKRTQPASLETTPKRPRVLQRRTADTSVPAENDDDTDDELVILETFSTPRPKTPGFDLTKVKSEQGQSDDDNNMLLECTEDAAVNVSCGTGSTRSPAVATSPSPAPPPELASTTTQTEMPKVKKEEEVENQTEERPGQSTFNKVVKSENQEKETLQNGVTHHPESDKAASNYSSQHPSITEVQEQQDMLLELMQVTAQERDNFKEQVSKLTCQLQDMQSRLQEQSQINIKKECSHQASQTEETVRTERGEDYKSLFERAKQKVDELIEDKKALLAATGTSPSIDPDEDKDIDEIALHVDSLLRELDQSNKEKEELRSQLDSLEEERANLASECEQLKLSLQLQRENVQDGNATPQTSTSSSVKTDPEEAGGTADQATDLSSDTLKSLIQLRQNIGQLLITHHVPALDLDQVNYECNVIDEILEQVVLNQLESVSAMGIGMMMNE